MLNCLIHILSEELWILGLFQESIVKVLNLGVNHVVPDVATVP